MVTGALLVSRARIMEPPSPSYQPYKCDSGRRGAAADELYPGIPIAARSWQLLRVQ